MKVRSLEQSNERYIRKSIMAFLEGEKDLKWVTGVLSKSARSKEAVLPILSRLQNYGDHTRFEELSRWLDSTEW